jgi:hypothetical protein
MKSRWLAAGSLVVMVTLAGLSCSSTTTEDIPLDTLAGDTNVPQAQVGNVISLGTV